MTIFFENLLLPENLIWAWRKTRRLYQASDGILNWGEVEEFDLHLEENLEAIIRDFKDGTYELRPIRPIAQPKRPKDGVQRFRQYFQFSVRDQVAWIAVANALARLIHRSCAIERRM